MAGTGLDAEYLLTVPSNAYQVALVEGATARRWASLLIAADVLASFCRNELLAGQAGGEE